MLHIVCFHYVLQYGWNNTCLSECSNCDIKGEKWKTNANIIQYLKVLHNEYSRSFRVFFYTPNSWRMMACNLLDISTHWRRLGFLLDTYMTDNEICVFNNSVYNPCLTNIFLASWLITKPTLDTTHESLLEGGDDYRFLVHHIWPPPLLFGSI